MSTRPFEAVQMGGAVVIAISANDSRTLSLVNDFLARLREDVIEEHRAEASGTAADAEKAFAGFQNGAGSMGAPATAPAPDAPAPPPVPAEGGALPETDDRGVPWDARYHAANRGKTQKGEWRAAKGLSDEMKAEKSAYEASFLAPATGEAPTPPVAPATGEAPTPPVAPATGEAPTPPVAPATGEAPTPPVAPATGEAPTRLPKGLFLEEPGNGDEITDLRTFMPWYNARKAKPGFMDDFATALQAFDLDGGLAALARSQKSIPDVVGMLLGMGH